jgi:hypothetical protein
MLEEMLEHMDDRSGSAWRHSLPGAPGVDFFDQHRFDPHVDIRGFPSHGDEVGRCGAWPLDNPGQKFDRQVGLYGIRQTELRPAGFSLYLATCQTTV